VLSRCQRFDLRRVEGELLQRHLGEIAAKEGVPIEPGALALIVRAAEGSVRDALSLLDQAIALAGGEAIAATQVQAMLGLADRSRVVDLFEHVARGAIRDALDCLAELYALGTEPEAVLQDLLEISHWLTRIKLAPHAAESQGMAQQDVVRGRALAEALSMPELARAWQMLLKGLEDVRLAPSPLLAAEMVLVRLAYAAELPPPAELIRRLGDGAEGHAAGTPAPTQREAPTPTRAKAPEAPVSPGSFAEAVALFEQFGEPMLHGWLYQAAQLVHFEPGRIELRLAPGTPADLPGRVAAALGRWTGQRWLVSLAGSDQGAAPTLAQEAAAARQACIDALAEDPRIKPILQQFPGAAIVDVRPAASR
jgi:DNA polymerase III subunit gamma/tau